MTTPGFNNPAYLVGQFGTPIWGVAGCPLPFTGNYFWVDETNGSDGNTGGPSDPFKTLTQALSRCTSGNSDVVFMVGSVHVTATVAWNLNKTHLIGLSPPSQNSRARIAISNTAATTGAVSPLVNVTGAGCWFQNIEGFNGINQAADQICWAEAGGENYYQNCNFIQTGTTAAASSAGTRALTIASGENRFDDCTIGGDTEVRATNANATLEFISGAPRNVFKRCIFQSWVTDASDVQVLINAGGADRYVLFEQCTFHNFGTTMTVAITNTAGGGPNCNVVLNNCIVIGATAIASSGQVFVNQISSGGTSATNYIGLLAT
jgi:hypothetical protein